MAFVVLFSLCAVVVEAAIVTHLLTAPFKLTGDKESDKFFKKRL
jgi:hypothetical protein